MPIIECGSVGWVGPNSPQSVLLHVGPTVVIDVGFDPAFITNMAAQGTVASGLQQNTQAPIFNPALPNIENVPALIDTGATMSCIDDQLAQQLGLPLINQVQSAGVHGSAPLNVYLAYLLIPSLSVAQTGEFIGANMAAGGQFHRALLGRTLLQNMLLVYDGRSGSVKLAN